MAPAPSTTPNPSRRAAEDAGAWRTEVWRALELGALAAFAFSRPVLDSFGRSPETFISRGAERWTIVAFGVIVAVAPAIVAGLVGLATRVLGPRRRSGAHLALVGVLGGVGVWRLGQDVTGWPGDATKLLVAGALAGALLALVRWQLPSAATFLRIAGAASVIFLAQFLFVSPASSLVLGTDAGIDRDVAKRVATQLGENPPDVVFIVFDALPLESLLDGTGHIDAELYPNFAALAGDASWYRNDTSVSGWTVDAVPALLTGRYPDPDTKRGTARNQRDNLFTLLGGSYDVEAKEEVTRLCPPEVCPRSAGGLSPLLGAAVDLWRDGVSESAAPDVFDLPGMSGGRIYADAARWIDQVDTRPAKRPKLVFHHIVLPHPPYRVTDDGTTYAGGNPPTGFFVNGWTRSGIPVGHQRHLLQVQAADRLLGRYLAKLRAAGTYDHSLVVVTADHGEAFIPDTPSRGLAANNYDQVMWTPLLVKAPGQAKARINDSDVRSIDIVPTIAKLLGIDLPWKVDGAPAGEATARDGATKAFDDSPDNQLRAKDGEASVEVDARAGFAKVLAADPVPGTGRDAVWKRTAHAGLFGRRVAGLDVGKPTSGDAAIAVDGLAHLAHIDTAAPLPLEVVGRTRLPERAVVAYALNGTIGAVTAVEPDRPGEQLADGLLPPRLFVDGANQLTAYLVDGPAGHEVLRPLEVRGP